jgi:hypothetical protein
MVYFLMLAGLIIGKAMCSAAGGSLSSKQAPAWD